MKHFDEPVTIWAKYFLLNVLAVVSVVTECLVSRRSVACLAVVVAALLGSLPWICPPLSSAAQSHAEVAFLLFCVIGAGIVLCAPRKLAFVSGALMALGAMGLISELYQNPEEIRRWNSETAQLQNINKLLVQDESYSLIATKKNFNWADRTSGASHERRDLLGYGALVIPFLAVVVLVGTAGSASKRIRILSFWAILGIGGGAALLPLQLWGAYSLQKAGYALDETRTEVAQRVCAELASTPSGYIAEWDRWMTIGRCDWLSGKQSLGREFYQATLLAEQSQPEQARLICLKLLQDRQLRAVASRLLTEVAVQQALESHSRSDFSGALRWWQEALRLDSDRYDAQIGAALAEFQSGMAKTEYVAARLKNAAERIDVPSVCSHLYAIVGDIYLQQKQVDQANEHFRIAESVPGAKHSLRAISRLMGM